MNFLKKNGAGILLCMALALIATALTNLHIGAFSLSIVGAPVFALLLGMLVTLLCPTFAERDAIQPGVKLSSKKILQWAVIILGFSLNLGTIFAVSAKSLPVIVSTIAASLLVAFLMRNALKMDGKVSCLIGVGSSICGGSAIAATAPIIDADDREIAQSISVVFLFNVLAALIFPALGHAIGLGSEGFAIFAGTAVNDTSSVTACASAAESIYGVEGILSAAVTVKLTRTLAIIPITLALAIHKARKARRSGGEGGSYSLKSVFPMFILYFVIAAIITTVVGVTSGTAFYDFYMGTFVVGMKGVAKFFIATAMCAVGLNTNLAELIRKGGKPILLGFTCWAAITAVSLGVQLLTGLFDTSIPVAAHPWGIG